MRFAWHWPALPGGISLLLGAPMHLMCFGRTDETWPGPPDRGIGMNVRAPVNPGPAPASVVQEHGVPTPVEADRSSSPAPRREDPANPDAEAETDRTSHEESRPRREEHNRWIVVGDHDIGRIHGHDRDVRPSADHDLPVAPQ